MQLGVWNLHVIFIFGVYDEWRKKNLGVLKNFFQKFFIRNFFFQKILVQKKFFFRNFWINFITKHVWDGKFELRMISAFIWCIYCLCRQKIANFPKLVYQVMKNFLYQTRRLREFFRGIALSHSSTGLGSTKDLSWK